MNLRWHPGAVLPHRLQTPKGLLTAGVKWNDHRWDVVEPPSGQEATQKQSGLLWHSLCLKVKPDLKTEPAYAVILNHHPVFALGRRPSIRILSWFITESVKIVHFVPFGSICPLFNRQNWPICPFSPQHSRAKICYSCTHKYINSLCFGSTIFAGIVTIKQRNR